MAFSIRTDILPLESSQYTMGDKNTNKKWLVNGHVKEVIELEIELQSSNGTSKTINDSRITAKHVVLDDFCKEQTGYIT